MDGNLKKDYDKSQITFDLFKLFVAKFQLLGCRGKFHKKNEGKGIVALVSIHTIGNELSNVYLSPPHSWPQLHPKNCLLYVVIIAFFNCPLSE